MAVELDKMLEQSPEICGGHLRIAGTRITVHQIAALDNQGQTAKEIVANCPYLTYAQVYAALAYYHANRQEIDAQLMESEEEYDELKDSFEVTDGR